MQFQSLLCIIQFSIIILLKRKTWSIPHPQKVIGHGSRALLAGLYYNVLLYWWETKESVIIKIHINVFCSTCPIAMVAIQYTAHIQSSQTMDKLMYSLRIVQIDGQANQTSSIILSGITSPSFFKRVTYTQSNRKKNIIQKVCFFLVGL